MPVEYIRWQPFSPSVGPSNPPTIPSMITPGTGCRDFGICKVTTSNHHHALFNMPHNPDRDAPRLSPMQHHEARRIAVQLAVLALPQRSRSSPCL